MVRIWCFFKLEFWNSVFMCVFLCGKFIEVYKYIVYCLYVFMCKIWINVLLEKDFFVVILVVL